MPLEDEPSETYIAHVKQTPTGGWEIHDLEDHLFGVAELAKDFAASFGSGDWAYLAGLWHDLGKYSSEFQNYIKTVSGYDISAHLESGRVDHSTAGAIHSMSAFPGGKVLAYLIAGHHAGLTDWENSEMGRAQLKYRLQQQDLLDRCKNRVPDRLLNQPPPTSKPPAGAAPALWIRLLFSCLVDADFLDTERFMDSAKFRSRSVYPDLASLSEKLNFHIKDLSENSKASPVNKIRNVVLEQCLAAAKGKPGIYSLTVPTGGGKTLSSLSFAMQHAVRTGKRRIIYVIPYTSIIEQASEVFRSIFGDCVLEHHSNFDPDKETVKSRLAAENWDAPIVVTTNVQFFESLFSSRTSRVRKLHRIMDSVVVLDEAQLIPSEFLQPTVSCLQDLSASYGVTLVLSTATQPALAGNIANLRGLTEVNEIIENPNELFDQLKRVEIVIPDNLNNPTTPEDLANELLMNEKVLCIVNRRDECRELYQLMPPDTIHLSGFMCGEHRSCAIAEIKKALSRPGPLRVVSTQLVEAGVDIDFPIVYRALSGIDCIAQAAGRCNREGNISLGTVKVFVPWKRTPRGHLSHIESASREILRLGCMDVLSPDVSNQYFNHLYSIKGSDLDRFNIVKDLKADGNLGIRFKSAALNFRVIDDSKQRSVFVRYGESPDLLSMFKRTGPDRWILRKLQRFSVSIPLYIFNELMNNGDVVEIHPGFFAQADNALYHQKTGFLGERVDLIDPELLIVS